MNTANPAISYADNSVTMIKEAGWKNKHNGRHLDIDQIGTTYYSDSIDSLLYGDTERKTSAITASEVITG